MPRTDFYTNGRGAQVAVASLAINYMTEQGIDISSAKASNLFSVCQAIFTVGRFVGVGILQFIDPALLLAIYAFMCTVLSLATSPGSNQYSTRWEGPPASHFILEGQLGALDLLYASLGLLLTSSNR